MRQPSRPSYFTNRSPYFSVAIALCASLLCGCGGGDGQATAGGPPGGGRPPALVRVAKIEHRPVFPKVTVVGTVTPKWTSIVASGADGLVDQFHVDEGQFVRRHDELSTLRMVTTELGINEAKAVLREREQQLRELRAGSRPEEIAEAQAKKLSAQAVLKNTESKFGRAKRLYAQNAINKDELDDAAEKAEAAKQAFLAANAVFERVESGPRIEQIEQSQARFQAQKEHVAFLEAEKQKRISRTPFDGFVVELHTYVGMWLSKGDPIVTVAILDEVDVVVNVDQRDLAHVRLGDSANVHVPGCRQTDWTGEITAVVPRSDWKTGSRGFPVEVRLKNRFYENKGQRLPFLKEGMMAEVTFTGSPVNAILVPKDSLVRTSRGTMIYTFDPDTKNPQQGIAHMHPVTTGLSDQMAIQVFADGLAAGMLVVTEGAERLQPFRPIQIAPQKFTDSKKDGPSTARRGDQSSASDTKKETRKEQD